MKRFLAIALLMLYSVPALAATLAFQFSIPPQNDAGANCATHVYSTAQTDSLWGVWKVPALSIVDSVWAPRGMLISRFYSVTGGTYQITAWTVRVVNGQRFASCDTTITATAWARARAIFDLK